MKTKFSPIKNIFTVTVLTLFLFSNSAFSQDDEFENYRFDDDKTSSQKTPYFALSFGETASFLFMNYDEINSKNNVFNDEFSGPMLTWGFNFFTALSPLINNARLGVSYQTGSKYLETSTNYPLLLPNGNTVNQNVNFYRNISLRATGIHFDYAFVPLKSLAILPGIGVKWGNMILEQYMTVMPADWNNIGVTTTIPFNEKLNYKFLAFEPTVNVEYAFTGYLMFRASASYMLTMDSPFVKNAWTINGNNAYTGVPEGVKPQGFSVTLGLYLGLFNY